MAAENRAELEENKNKNEEIMRKTDSKSYSLLMEPHEDKRKSKRKFLTKGRILTLLFVSIIILANLAVVYPLFKPGFPQFDSGLSRILSQINVTSHNLFGNWDSTWYLGFPSYFLSNVLLTYLFSFVKLIFGLANLAFLARFLLGLLYLLVPVSIYFFTRYLSKKEFTALFAALLFSAPPFLFFWLPQVRDLFAAQGFIPWGVYHIKTDLTVLSHYFALFLGPLAAIYFMKVLREFTYKNLLIAASFFAITSFAFSLNVVMTVILTLILLISEAILGHPGEKIRRAVIFLLVYFGLIAAKYNLPYLANAYEANELGQVFRNLATLLPLAFVILPILATLLFLIFDRKPKLQILFISLVTSGLFIALVSAFTFWQKEYVPEPSLLYLEMQMVISILVAYLISLLVIVFRKYVSVKLMGERANIAVSGLIIILICLAVGLTTWNFKKAGEYLAPQSSSQLEEKSIHQVSEWLGERVAFEERVFVAGRLSEWLNFFTLVPQVKGASDTASVSDLWKKAALEIEKGERIEKTESYLRLLGAKYIVVKRPAEDETEREKWIYYYPDKFKKTKILTLKETFGLYDIYEVDLDNPSLAQVVDDLEYQELQKKNLEDNLADYAAVMDNDDYSVHYTREKEARISLEAELKPNQAVVLKENYFRTWRATIKEENISVNKDPLGYIYLKPKKEGFVEINLVASKELSQYIGYGFSLLTVLLIVFFRTRRMKKLVNKYQTMPSPKGILERKPARETSFVDMMTDREEELIRKSENIKEHYQKTEDVDWVETSDNFASLSAYFHRNREALSKKLIEKFGRGEKYLDAGCGTGLLLRHLPKGSIGLDINPQNIASAKKNVPEAALVVADIENIPFPSNMFDTVVCAEVLDRLPHPKKAIKEIFRVLKPGGVLIGTVPRENPLWRLRFLSSAYSPEPYRFEYSRKDIIDLLAPFERVVVSPALSYMTWAFVVKKEGGITEL